MNSGDMRGMTIYVAEAQRCAGDSLKFRANLLDPAGD